MEEITIRKFRRDGTEVQLTMEEIVRYAKLQTHLDLSTVRLVIHKVAESSNVDVKLRRPKAA